MTSEANPGGLPPELAQGPGPIRRFVLPGLFIIALIVALFMRRPDVDSTATMWKLQGEIFGTTYVVKVLPQGSKVDQTSLKEEIDVQLASVDLIMSTYKDNSELSKFNNSRTTEPVKISAELANVLQEAIRVTTLTRGAFDITVGPLVNLWGFGPNKALKDPSPEALAEARKSVGIKQFTLDIDKLTLQKHDEKVYIDLSAIAKGYAVDRVGEILEKHKIASYMVEVGGEIRARGRNAKGVHWQLGVERPQGGPTQEVALVVPLDDLSMATTGNYRNFYVRADGRRVSHAIDARSGEPVEHPFSSVTVLHPDCMIADALATGLFAMGAEEGLQVAENHQLAVVYVLPDGEGFTTKASSSFPDFHSK
jgi:FAD:protein FMN transferase